eukprot:836357-Pyramimonas_sp.AAC.1
MKTAAIAATKVAAVATGEYPIRACLCKGPGGLKNSMRFGKIPAPCGRAWCPGARVPGAWVPGCPVP